MQMLSDPNNKLVLEETRSGPICQYFIDAPENQKETT